MDVKLREILSSIDSRFSGPASCRVNDMLSGKIDFDSEEVKDYLTGIKNFADIHGNDDKNNVKDAEAFLQLIIKYKEENKTPVQHFSLNG